MTIRAGIIDKGMHEGLFCSYCDEQLFPDCDISSNSVWECFEEHMWESHGLKQMEED